MGTFFTKAPAWIFGKCGPSPSTLIEEQSFWKEIIILDKAMLTFGSIDVDEFNIGKMSGESKKMSIQFRHTFKTSKINCQKLSNLKN